MAPAPAAPAGAPSIQSGDDKNDITIGQAVSALVGAGIGAGIEAVGNTASSLVRLPQALFYAYKALWNTEQIGPVLKTTIAATLPVGAVLAPILTAVGSAGVGAVRGFEAGMKGGVGEAIRETASDVKYFHKELSGKLVEGLQKWETEPLPPGEKPFDIHPLQGARALAGGALAMGIDAVGVGGLTLVKTPRAVVRAYEEIFKSDQGPVLKTTEAILVPPLAILATPTAVVAGAIWGLATGVSKGYTEGFSAAVKQGVDNVKDYHKWTEELLQKD
jgi:hypothetical protein